MTSLSDNQIEPVFIEEPTPEPPAPIFDHVMIDIETLSLHRHKALILSIGMVEFDPTQSVGLVIGARSLLIPEFARQITLGRQVSVSTQAFWAKQPAEASAHWMENFGRGMQLEHICGLVRSFCKGKCRVWANGTQFDLSNLEGLADDIGEKELWHYQSPRDMRTFVKETPNYRVVPFGDACDIPGVPHEPVYDCISQAWQVWGHWNEKN